MGDGTNRTLQRKADEPSISGVGARNGTVKPTFTCEENQKRTSHAAKTGDPDILRLSATTVTHKIYHQGSTSVTEGADSLPAD